MSSSLSANTYWVSPSGSNDNNCEAATTPCQTIDHAATKAISPGDIVNIMEGTYYETTGGHVWNTGSNEVGIKIRGSGTQDKPITFQAAPGDEGKAIIDQNGENDEQQRRIAFNIDRQDYIVIKNLHMRDCYTACVLNIGTRAVPINTSGLSIGVQILNNYIHHIDGQKNGTNPAGIRFDGSMDWVIRNNEIGWVAANLAGTTGYRDANAAAIKAYVAVNTTVENNLFYEAGDGIHWKDHTEGPDGALLNGSSIKYNIIRNVGTGVYITTGDGSGKAGNHTISNNIFHDMNHGISFYYPPLGSANSNIENNIFDNTNPAILSAKYEKISTSGNIFYDSEAYRLFHNTSITSILDKSDHNIFSGGVDIRADWNGGTSYKQYNALSTWQGISSETHKTVSVNSPDTNSLTVSEASLLFKDISTKNYKHSAGSPALGILPDGSNAGPYQNGDETIGLLAGYAEYSTPESKALPPSGLSAVIN